MYKTSAYFSHVMMTHRLPPLGQCQGRAYRSWSASCRFDHAASGPWSV